jgi:hypothetical protein
MPARFAAMFLPLIRVALLTIGDMMRSRAILLVLGAAALLGMTVARTQAYTYYGYYGSWRQCWVTDSGLGVCAPVPIERTAARQRRVRERRR